MTLLAVRHASLGYSRHPVLRDVSFTLSQGTICCLLGANGCGKTTLMRSILGVIPLLKGEILLDSLPVQTLSHRQRAQAIAWVPQAHDGIFAFSVLDMVLMGLAPTIGAFSVPGKQERLKATEQLEKLGILHLATRRWNTLSGGERQLALIARALVQQPRLLLLDEPASSLDFGHQIQLLDTLAQLKNNGMTMLMSTHHPLHANAIADSIIQVEPDGRVTQGLPTEQLTTKNWLPCTGFLPTRFTITSLQLSTKEKSCSLTILILQTFTFSNSGWPIAQKNAGSLGSTGGKNGGKLRLAYGQLPATTDLKN